MTVGGWIDCGGMYFVCIIKRGRQFYGSWHASVRWLGHIRKKKTAFLPVMSIGSIHQKWRPKASWFKLLSENFWLFPYLGLTIPVGQTPLKKIYLPNYWFVFYSKEHMSIMRDRVVMMYWTPREGLTEGPFMWPLEFLREASNGYMGLPTYVVLHYIRACCIVARDLTFCCFLYQITMQGVWSTMFHNKAKDDDDDDEEEDEEKEKEWWRWGCGWGRQWQWWQWEGELPVVVCILYL